MSRCEKAVEGLHEECCLHDRFTPVLGWDQVCCWCGEIYLARQAAPDYFHGKYVPDYAKTEGKRR